jgi:hypothetical protein
VFFSWLSVLLIRARRESVFLALVYQSFLSGTSDVRVAHIINATVYTTTGTATPQFDMMKIYFNSHQVSCPMQYDMQGLQSHHGPCNLLWMLRDRKRTIYAPGRQVFERVPDDKLIKLRWAQLTASGCGNYLILAAFWCSVTKAIKHKMI